MLKTARILSVIGLIISLVVGIITIGTSVGLTNADVIDDLEHNSSESDLRNIDIFKKYQYLLIIGFPIAIITGILGIIGPNKKPINIKPKYFWIVLLFCVILTFIFRQSFPAIIYGIVVIFYFVHFIKNEQIKNKPDY